jgi:hypothetical protein
MSAARYCHVPTSHRSHRSTLQQHGQPKGGRAGLRQDREPPVGPRLALRRGVGSGRPALGQARSRARIFRKAAQNTPKAPMWPTEMADEAESSPVDSLIQPAPRNIASAIRSNALLKRDQALEEEGPTYSNKSTG